MVKIPGLREACDHCHSKKVGCVSLVGGMACTNCEKLSKPCWVSASRAGGVFKNGVKLGAEQIRRELRPSARGVTGTLEARIAEVEQLGIPTSMKSIPIEADATIDIIHAKRANAASMSKSKSSPGGVRKTNRSESMRRLASSPGKLQGQPQTEHPVNISTQPGQGLYSTGLSVLNSGQPGNISTQPNQDLYPTSLPAPNSGYPGDLSSQLDQGPHLTSLPAPNLDFWHGEASNIYPQQSTQQTFHNGQFLSQGFAPPAPQPFNLMSFSDQFQQAQTTQYQSTATRSFAALLSIMQQHNQKQQYIQMQHMQQMQQHNQVSERTFVEDIGFEESFDVSEWTFGENDDLENSFGAMQAV